MEGSEDMQTAPARLHASDDPSSINTFAVEPMSSSRRETDRQAG